MVLTNSGSLEPAVKKHSVGVDIYLAGATIIGQIHFMILIILKSGKRKKKGNVS